MALALLVSFQEQKQKSYYELAKARIFLRARAHDNNDHWKSNFEKRKSVIGGGISKFSLCHS